MVFQNRCRAFSRAFWPRPASLEEVLAVATAQMDDNSASTFWLVTVKYKVFSGWSLLLLLLGARAPLIVLEGVVESLLTLATLSGTGDALIRREGSLEALNVVALSFFSPVFAPDAVLCLSTAVAELLSFTASNVTFTSLVTVDTDGVWVVEGRPAFPYDWRDMTDAPFWPWWVWLDSSREAVLLTPIEAGRNGVGVLLLLLGANEIAVILTTFTELTWDVGITVLMGLLVMRSVGGERRAMALVTDGLGKIWAYRCLANLSPTGLAGIFWGVFGDCLTDCVTTWKLTGTTFPLLPQQDLERSLFACFSEPANKGTI